MSEVLEIEQVEIKKREEQESKIASWMVEIPLGIIKELDLIEGSRIALTFNDGKITGDVLPPLSSELKVISKRILEKNRVVYEELKQLGD